MLLNNKKDILYLIQEFDLSIVKTSSKTVPIHAVGNISENYLFYYKQYVSGIKTFMSPPPIIYLQFFGGG